MKDERVKEYFAPVRVLACEGVTGAQEQCGACGEKPQASLYPAEHMLSAKGKGFVLFDFGREYHGGVRLITFLARGTVRIRFGESASEACASVGEKGAGNDHALRDFSVELVSFSDTEYGCTGYRFVRLDFEEDSDISLTGVFGSCVYRALETLGHFECDDEEINRIWRTAARTLHLNLQNMLWDGIKRDRLVWVGDMYPEMLTLTDLYGRDGCIGEALEFVRKNTRSRWMNGIPSYSAWWVLNALEYGARTGDFSYAAAHTGEIREILREFLGCVREGALFLGEEEMSSYFDWPTHGTPDAGAGVHALVRFAALRAEAVLPELGDDPAEAVRLLRALSDVPVKSDFKQVTAMQYLAGMAPENSGKKLISGGARGMSSFQSYFILKAAAETAGTRRAFDMMREFFGGMLKLGATTFWEDFDVEWLNACPIDRLPSPGERDVHGDYGKFCYQGFRHSLCHGWASGVLPFLTECVAGVRRTGVHSASLLPDLCGLEYLHARVPLADGILEFECEPGRTKILSAPQGTDIVERGRPVL